jgi:hypothetical protein
MVQRPIDCCHGLDQRLVAREVEPDLNSGRDRHPVEIHDVLRSQDA